MPDLVSRAASHATDSTLQRMVALNGFIVKIPHRMTMTANTVKDVNQAMVHHRADDLGLAH
jgi:hypothetical protein